MSNQEEEDSHQSTTGQQNQEIVGEDSKINKQQCRRNGKKWQCSKNALPGKLYCEKHQVEQDVHNEKRRKFPKKPNRFLDDPVLPSGEHQCRRNGKGWRCSDMAPPGERYCHKHELEQMRYNEKRRKEGCRKRKQIVPSEYGEMKSFSDDSTVLKKIREEGRRSLELVNCDGRRLVSDEFSLETSLVDVSVDISLYPERTAFTRVEGTEDGDAKNNLTIEEIDGMQLLDANSEEHQTPCPSLEMSDPPTVEGWEADDQPLPNESSSINKSSAMIEETESLVVIQQHSDSHTSEKVIESGAEGKALPSVDIIAKKSSSQVQQDNGDLHVEDEYRSTVESSQMLEDIDCIDTSELISQHSDSRPLGDEVKEVCEWFISKVSTDVDVRSQLEELLKLRDEYNLPDDRSKTAAKEFVGEKHQFDTMLARLNMRLEPLLAELEMKGLKVVELQRILDEIKE